MWFIHDIIAGKTAALATESKPLFRYTITGEAIAFCMLFYTPSAISRKICRASATIEAALAKQFCIHNSHLQTPISRLI